MKCLYIVTSVLLLPIKNKTNNMKHVICQHYNMQLQKELTSKDVKSKVVAKKWL